MGIIRLWSALRKRRCIRQVNVRVSVDEDIISAREELFKWDTVKGRPMYRSPSVPLSPTFGIVTNFPNTSQPIPLYPPSKLRAQRRPGPLKPHYGVPRSEWLIILRRVEQGESLRGIAQDYHVSYQTIHRIVQTGRKQGEEGQQ